MRSVVRYLPFIAVAAIALSLLTYAFWPRAIDVEVILVTRGPLSVTVDEDGRTRVKERYIVSSPLSGQMARIELHPGDSVVAEQTVLAAIHPTAPALLDARLLAEAESRVKAAEAAKEQADARLDSAREAHALAIDEFDRAKRLREDKAISQAEYDTAEHQERIAGVTLRAAEFGQRVALFEFALAQSAFVRTRPNSQDDGDSQRLDLKSPVNGKVLRVMHESAGVVAPGQPLLEIGNPAELEVEVDVLSTDAARMTPGAKVWLDPWGGTDRPLEARVRLVEPSGFMKLSALGVEEQRVNVIADFVEPAERLQGLGDAFRVNAQIVVWQQESVVKVPSGALFRRLDSWGVFVVTDRRARLRQVQIGQNNGLEAEVLSGLAVDEVVIAYPSDSVHDGVRIKARGR